MAASRLPLWVRRTHKWLSLVIGIQALLWVLGGLYMVVVPIEIVHGDHLASTTRAPLAPGAARIDAATIAERHPGMTGFAFKQLLGREVVEVREGKKLTLLDAVSGAPLGALSREQAESLARSIYAGDGSLRDVEWLTSAPREVGGRTPPLWAAHFDDRFATTLYFSAVSGELVGRRSDLWRWFDVMWMLHIMDYEERENVNNSLLRASTILALGVSLTGVWMLVLWLRRRKAR
jgi:hypothetical protein